MKEVVESIQKQKKETYLMMEETSSANAESITKMKHLEQRSKEMKREKVKQEEARGKESRIQMEDMKQSRFKEDKKSQVHSLKLQERKKQRQLQDLTNMEMELVRQQAQSQSAYLKVKDQLDQLLNQAKTQHYQSKRNLKASVHCQQP